MINDTVNKYINESKDKMKRLQLKVGVLTGKTKGNVKEMDVYELADELGMEITKRQAQNMIRKSKKEYGY